MATIYDLDELKPKQTQAIAALLTAPSIAAAAAAAGVGERTLHRWLREPAFAECYRDARRDALAQAGAQLQGMAGVAAACLLEVMRDPESSAAARVSAAREALTFAADLLRLEDIDARLAAVERAQEARGR